MPIIAAGLCGEDNGPTTQPSIDVWDSFPASDISITTFSTARRSSC